MKLLLHTHTLIWFSIGDDKMLSKEAKKAIENIDNDLYVSIVSFWEIAIKIGLGKLHLTKEVKVLADFLSQSGISTLSVSVNHTIKLLDLKFHHRDPFDRMLIAQSMEEGFSVITKDKNFSLYNIKTIW